MKQEEKSLKLQKAEEQVRIANARLAEVQKEERQKERDRQNRHKGSCNYFSIDAFHIIGTWKVRV